MYFLLFSALFSVQAKIGGSILIADPANDLSKRLFIGGIFAVFDPFADQIAKNAAEIFMAGIGKKTAGIGEHSDEITKQGKVRKRTKLRFHAALGIVEPPCRAVLNLAAGLGALECTDHGTDQFVILRI